MKPVLTRGQTVSCPILATADTSGSRSENTVPVLNNTKDGRIHAKIIFKHHIIKPNQLKTTTISDN
jgi:hypothetical protein